jgi:hypothetical protein
MSSNDPQVLETIEEIVEDIRSCRTCADVRYRRLTSLGRLASSSSSLCSLVGEVLGTQGIRCIIKDLRHKNPTVRSAAAQFLATLAHDNVSNQQKMLKETGFAIGNVWVFWIPKVHIACRVVVSKLPLCGLGMTVFAVSCAWLHFVLLCCCLSVAFSTVFVLHGHVLFAHSA